MDSARLLIDDDNGWTQRLYLLVSHPGARDPPPFLVGDDLRLRPLWQLRRLRRTRQHLLNLQVSLPLVLII